MPPRRRTPAAEAKSKSETKAVTGSKTEDASGTRTETATGSRAEDATATASMITTGNASGVDDEPKAATVSGSVTETGTGAGTVRTSIMVLSDTHLNTPFQKGIPKDLPKIDLLIHAGDLTLTGSYDELESALDLLVSIPAKTKLVIPGNHDLCLDRGWMNFYKAQFWVQKNEISNWAGQANEEYWRECEKMWFGPESRAVKAGVIMLREGRHVVTLENGATVRVSALSLPYSSLVDASLIWLHVFIL